MLRLACIACLLSALAQAVPVAADLFTEKPLSIKTLLVDPNSYELHSVTLHGVVRELRLLDPPFVPIGDGVRCRNAYTFRLDDGTASVVVGVRMNCQRQPPVIDLDVVAGETVFIEGNVLGPATYIDEALSPFMKVRADVLVVAQRIWR